MTGIIIFEFSTEDMGKLRDDDGKVCPHLQCIPENEQIKYRQYKL